MWNKLFPGSSPSRDSGAAPEWAVTWGDLMSLLLIFFVLVCSYSTMDLAKYKAMAGSMRAAFGVGEHGAESPKLRSVFPAVVNVATERARREVEEELLAIVRELGADGPMEILATFEGTRIRIEGAVMFDLGSAALRQEARPLLARLAPLFARYPYKIWVEGHTDDLPIQNQVFPSNWELSAARAGSVVRNLILSGGVSGEHLAAVGYADTQPLRPNVSYDDRSRNRRVEFLLSRPASAER